MSQAYNKRTKKFYGGSNFNKKSRFALHLTTGMKGFLCTCNCPPKFCIREAYNILDEFAKPVDNAENKEETEKDPDDVDDELKKELESLKKESRNKEFQVVESGVTGCIFVKSTKSNPSEIMDTLIQRILDSGKGLCRNILRMLPVEVTCKAYLDDIKRSAGPIFDEHFKGDAKTFAIVVNRRNSSHIVREEIIEALAVLIRDRNPKHSADLKNPQFTVLIEILKSVCCISVLADYNKKKKYNLLELGIACQKESGDGQECQDEKETDVMNEEENDDVQDKKHIGEGDGENQSNTKEEGKDEISENIDRTKEDGLKESANDDKDEGIDDHTKDGD